MRVKLMGLGGFYFSGIVDVDVGVSVVDLEEESNKYYDA